MSNNPQTSDQTSDFVKDLVSSITGLAKEGERS